MRAPHFILHGAPDSVAVLTSGAERAWPGAAPSHQAHQGRGMPSRRLWRAARPRVYDKGFRSVWKGHKKQPEKTPVLGTAGVAGAPRKAGEVPRRELVPPQTAEATCDIPADTRAARGQPRCLASWREAWGSLGPGGGATMIIKEDSV